MPDKINSWCVPFALGKITGRTSNDIAALIAKARGEGDISPDKVRRVNAKLYLGMLPSLGVKVLAELQRPKMALITWSRVRAKWGDKMPWLLRVSGHALVYRDGLFYDNTHPHGAPVESYRYAKSRICSARQVDSWSDLNPQRLV
jgi:hypothetical protein